MVKLENCQEKSDEDLAKLALKNQEWFFCLVKRYENKLARYIKRISNVSKQEIEDILQEVFLKVYQNLNDFDASLKFSSWIYRITHNQVISSFRKTRARPRQIFLDNEGDILNNLASNLDLEKETDQKDLKNIIEKSLKNLSGKYSEVLILKFLEDKDYKEISDILKKPIGTVATLINRGKKKLKEELLKQNLV